MLKSMKTHTHLEKWDKITKWSIAALIIGFTITTLVDINDGPWWIGTPFNLASITGLVMSFVGAPKVFGGLKVGVFSLIAGAVIWFTGMTMKDVPEPSIIVGVEFPPLSDPLYTVGWDFVYYGAIIFIVGGIMAAVSYLRRVLRAVESKTTTSN